MDENMIQLVDSLSQKSMNFIILKFQQILSENSNKDKLQLLFKEIERFCVQILEQKSQFQDILLLLQVLQEESEKRQMWEIWCQALNDIGCYQRRMGDYRKAQDYFELSLRSENDLYHSLSYMNLAALYSHLKKTKQAIQYGKKAVRISLDTLKIIESDPSIFNKYYIFDIVKILCISTYNLGHQYFLEKDFLQTKIFYQQCYDLLVTYSGTQSQMAKKIINKIHQFNFMFQNRIYYQVSFNRQFKKKQTNNSIYEDQFVKLKLNKSKMKVIREPIKQQKNFNFQDIKGNLKITYDSNKLDIDFQVGKKFYNHQICIIHLRQFLGKKTLGFLKQQLIDLILPYFLIDNEKLILNSQSMIAKTEIKIGKKFIEFCKIDLNQTQLQLQELQKYQANSVILNEILNSQEKKKIYSAKVNTNRQKANLLNITDFEFIDDDEVYETQYIDQYIKNQSPEKKDQYNQPKEEVRSKINSIQQNVNSIDLNQYFNKVKENKQKIYDLDNDVSPIEKKQQI